MISSILIICVIIATTQVFAISALSYFYDMISLIHEYSNPTKRTYCDDVMYVKGIEPFTVRLCSTRTYHRTDIRQVEYIRQVEFTQAQSKLRLARGTTATSHTLAQPRLKATMATTRQLRGHHNSVVMGLTSEMLQPRSFEIRILDLLITLDRVAQKYFHKMVGFETRNKVTFQMSNAATMIFNQKEVILLQMACCR